MSAPDPNCLIELLMVTPEYLDHVRQTDVRGIPCVVDPVRMHAAIWPMLANGATMRVFVEISEPKKP